MPSLKRVSMEEANAFLSVKSRTAKTIAYAAFLCILSPIALLILGAISESTSGGLSEDIAGGIGMIALIIFVAIYIAYWVIATAIYLGYSLSSNNWGQSWIIWVVAGVMFPAIVAITNAFDKKSK